VFLSSRHWWTSNPLGYSWLASPLA
jgi:hypothetical protein